MPTDQYKVLIRADMKPAGEHARRFNEPVTNEVVVVIVGNDFEKRDILLEKKNGRKLRVDEYIHLKDAIDNDGRANNRGQLVILPATFTGSLRHMHEYTQEAMTYVRNHERPDLFITFTCNPKWQEIQEELMEGQAPSDRQDLLARVFRQKLIQLANIITKVMYLGQQDARCILLNGKSEDYHKLIF
ncbi:unnamed protein product [Rotaria magnacalcarata]|uniref:Helitron helicase-like domain-containing protein n=1 Tax=Rotaria magnacalcarata TaxID=392030 RepID=A0A815B7G3_9BILA|nr:unnamed protein product [Rotaria magnacalcarata]CAF1609370.1 unnamed protein product [Rotaria magnacalcarata]